MTGHTHACIDCGVTMAESALNLHVKVCDEEIECQWCGMKLLRSTKSTHDSYVCSGQMFISLCPLCHIQVNNSESEHHNTVCSFAYNRVDTVSRQVVAGTARQNVQTVYTNENIEQLNRLVSSITNSVCEIGSHGRAYTDVPSCSGKITPNARRKFNALLQMVECRPGRATNNKHLKQYLQSA